MSITERILSLKDPRVIEARDLTSAVGRNRSRKLLLLGLEQLEWAEQAGLMVEHIFVACSEKQQPHLPDSVATAAPRLLVTEGISKKITDTNYAVSIVGVARTPAPKAGTCARLVLVLDDVCDPGNIGTLVRTARAFGIRDIWATTSKVEPFSRKAVDASRGLVFSTRFHPAESPERAASQLKQAGYEIVVTSPHAVTLQSRLQLSGARVALVAGNETNGVSRALTDAADHVVQIPMRAIESLNVAVAAGITIYELGYKLVLAKITDSIRGILGRELGSTHELMHRLMDKRLGQTAQIGANEVVFLMRLACDRRSPLADVAKDLQRNGQYLEEFLSQLVERGWARMDGQGQERSVAITEAGEVLLAQLWPVVESTHDIAVAGLSDGEQKQLSALLQRIQGNCFKELNRPQQHL